MTRYIKTLLLFSICLGGEVYALTLDGMLDDEEWKTAELFTDFVTVSPFSLESADYQTEARIFTNEDGIYIGVKNQQPRETQKSERTARDGNIFSDSNAVAIDFDNTGISGYHFEVANGGSMLDGIWRNETSFSNEWNGIWSAKTSNDEENWYSEIFIPWDVAPMASAENGQRTVGLYLKRYVASNSKRYSSAPIDDSRQRFLSEFENVAINDYAKSSLQVFGYATWRDNRITGNKNNYDMGVDVFWKPSSSKQLSVTINPDFGQVESDNLVVNFSPEETFFSENRPFFTENQAIFDMSGANNSRILHTRRIGGAPDVGNEVGSDIVGAMKFTSVGEDFSYGLLSAIEGSDSVADGRNYYVGRVLRKTDDYSIGYMLTYTDRPDIDRDATVHAADYSYNFTKDIKMTGQVIYSDISAVTGDSSDSGAWTTFSHQITDTWDQKLEVVHYGDELQINDAGFLRRNNFSKIDYSSNKTLFNFSDNNPLQELRYGAGIDYSKNTYGEKLNSSIRFNTNYTFKNTGNGFSFIRFETGGVDDLITRGNGNLNTDSGVRLNIIYFADRRNKFQWHIRGNYFDRTVDGNGYFIHFHPSYQFNDKYQLRVGFTYTESTDWLIWQGGTQLNTFDQERLLTEVDFTANISDKQEFSMKFEWIALQAKAQQAFLVNGSGNLSEFNTPVEDFNLSNVAAQLHYRYEIAPLSNIYVVYSRGGQVRTNEDSSLSSLFSPGWEERDGDNFIVKVRYQF